MGIETLISSRQAKKASQAQQQGADQAVDEQRRQYDLTRGDFARYREAGTNALQQLVARMEQPTTREDVMQDPGYQFGMDQGMQALSRRQSAMGGRVSGQAMKAATRYGTDYGATGYNAAYQRRQDVLNRLGSIAGVGQTATSQGAQMGGQQSNAISNIMMQRGDNQGAYRMAQGNIWGNAAGDAQARIMRLFGGGG